MIFPRAILVAASVLWVSTAGYSADCLMGRYTPDQRSYTPERLQLPVALNWEFTGDKFDNNLAAPVVEGTRCYISCGDRIYAVDMESGRELWKYPSSGPLGSTIKSTPVVSQGRVYFGAGDGNLYCLNGKTGQFMWAYQTRGPIRCSPALYDGVIYFGTDDNSVYAVDAESGEAVWNKPFTARDDMAHGLAVSNGMVIISCMDGNMYGLTASVGKLRWMYRLPTASVKTWPMVSDGIAIMALGNLVYGFTATSGQLRWMIQLPSEVASSPASDGSTLFVPCRDQNIYAYNLKGRQPAVKWTAPAELGAMAMAPPTVANDTLFVTGSKGVVAAFSTEDGSLKWRYMVAPSYKSGTSYTDAASSPVVANGNLLVHTEDGVLHCFSPNAPDAEVPIVYDRKPGNAYSIPAVPPFRISALVYDIGSGVDYSSISVQMDGQSVDYTVDFSTSTISAIYGMPVEGKPAKSLADGIHTIKITGKDYMGNPLSDQWVYFADSSLTPPKRTVAETGRRTVDPTTGNTTGGQPSRTTPNQGNTDGRSNWGDRSDRSDRDDRSDRGGPPAPTFGRGRTPQGFDGDNAPPPPPAPGTGGGDAAVPQPPPIVVE